MEMRSTKPLTQQEYAALMTKKPSQLTKRERRQLKYSYFSEIELLDYLCGRYWIASRRWDLEVVCPDLRAVPLRVRILVTVHGGQGSGVGRYGLDFFSKDFRNPLSIRPTTAASAIS